MSLMVEAALTRCSVAVALTRCSVAVAMTRLSAVAVQISLMVVTALTYLNLMASVGVTAEGGDGTDTVQLVW